MLIDGLKEGSAGLLPLSGAAPAIWVGWKGKEEDEGEREEQSKHYFSSDHSCACRGNIWGIFNSNIFHKKFSNKGRCHESALLSPNGRQGQHTFHMLQPYQYTSPWPEETCCHSHLRGPFNLAPRFDGLWKPVFCKLNWEPLTEFTHHKPAVRQEHPRLSGNKHLEVNGTVSYYKSLKLSSIPLQGSLVTLSLNASVWRGLGSRQKLGKGGGQKL